MPKPAFLVACGIYLYSPVLKLRLHVICQLSMRVNGTGKILLAFCTSADIYLRIFSSGDVKGIQTVIFLNLKLSFHLHIYLLET